MISTTVTLIRNSFVPRNCFKQLFLELMSTARAYSCQKFNVSLTVHRDVSVQQEPTGCTIRFQFIQ